MRLRVLSVIYLFDVDGTITPSRGRIDAEFGVWFSKFVENNYVCLVTGSDRVKTIEQVGEYIYSKCERVYQCSGNDVWRGDRNIRTNSWKLPKRTHSWLEDKLEESDFSIRTGNHIEQRPGMVNFSVVGRNADTEDRARYSVYDGYHGERGHIADMFNETFPNLSATVAGETGIDIYPKDSGKEQVLTDFDKSAILCFIGDMCEKGGNDYTISQAIDKRDKCEFYNVEDWRETWDLLKREL
jgi:phosphomannomutase